MRATLATTRGFATASAEEIAAHSDSLFPNDDGAASTLCRLGASRRICSTTARSVIVVAASSLRLVISLFFMLDQRTRKFDAPGRTQHRLEQLAVRAPELRQALGDERDRAVAVHARRDQPAPHAHGRPPRDKLPARLERRKVDVEARVPEDLAALHRYERAPRAPHAPQARGLNSDDGDRAPEEGSDQEECAVCITNAGRYKLECGHTFCGTCLEKIYASEQLAQKCPLCRGPLTRVRFEDRLFFGSRHWPLPALLRVLDEAVGRGGLAGLSGLSNPRAIPPERAVSGAQRAKCDLYARKAVCHLQRAEHSTARAAHIARALQYARKAVCVRCGKRAARRYELG